MYYKTERPNGDTFNLTFIQLSRTLNDNVTDRDAMISYILVFCLIWISGEPDVFLGLSNIKASKVIGLNAIFK